MFYKNFVKKDINHDEILSIPFIAQDIHKSKLILAFDAFELLLGLENQIQDISDQIKMPLDLKMTGLRLKKIRDSLEGHKRELSKILAPLKYRDVKMTEFNQYLSQKRSGHILMNGYSHVFRDWGWGEEEIQASVAIAKSVLGNEQPKHILTLGAGASRFPYEIHRLLNPEYSLCVDVNPFLLYCASEVINGNKLKLMEFPITPKDINLFAVTSELKCSTKLKDGTSIGFLVHDLLEWGFLSASFDMIITPWFIDVAPLPPRNLFALINKTLKKGGIWLNQGSVGFVNRFLANYLSKEEVASLVEKSGFKFLNSEYKPVPYFQNPSSGHWRTEHVYCFAAKKEKELEVKETDLLPQNIGKQMLPAWVHDTTKPIELSLPKDQMAASFKFSERLLSLLTPDKSVADLSRVLANEFEIQAAQAEYLILNTLLQWADARRYNPLQ
ncbi:MAG: hypothetical protein A4S09_07920 [Proteobacteria bacterium SG_bin7]|nr:MAG: hypothetical protein A4S09_07920 [Proteobacteria bacterium SG_bin7]